MATVLRNSGRGTHRGRGRVSHLGEHLREKNVLKLIYTQHPNPIFTL